MATGEAMSVRSQILTNVASVATVVGLGVALLAYCVPSTSSEKPASTTPSKLAPPPVRPLELPTNHVWANASGPANLNLKSSVAVIQNLGRATDQVHVRFTLTSFAPVPLQIWATSETMAAYRPVEAWVIDAGSTKCEAPANNFVSIPVADKGEAIVKSNDIGELSERVPTIASRGSLSFSVRFECDGRVVQSAVLFATIRLTVGYRSARTTDYFQTTALPLYLDIQN